MTKTSTPDAEMPSSGCERRGVRQYVEPRQSVGRAYYEPFIDRFLGTEAEPFASSLVDMAVGSQTGHPAYDYRSIYDFLLQEGLSFELKHRPRDLRAGVRRRCYANCYVAATRHAERYAYCEGIVYLEPGIPISHAWLLDLRDGRAVDPTWDVDPTVLAYIGVVVDTRYLHTAYIHSGCVIDDWQARHPILRRAVGDAWRHDWHRQSASKLQIAG